MKNHSVLDTVNFREVESECQPLGSVVADSEMWQAIPEPDQGARAPVSRLLVYFQDDEGREVRSYANNVGNLLRSEISFLEGPANGDIKRINQEANDCNLVLFGVPKHSLLKRLRTGCLGCRGITRLPTSLLVIRQPRWPILNILLILRIEETDEAAVAWALRVAQASGATLTILPIVPWLPAMHNLGNRIQPEMNVLLSPNTPSGHKVNQIVQQLLRRQIEYALHLGQGKPDLQIREEVSQGNYDLIIIGSEPYGRVCRLLLGELVAPLLRWVDLPLLIACPPPLAVE
jgi:nucleotide-binding universal stress UspA family protein